MLQVCIILLSKCFLQYTQDPDMRVFIDVQNKVKIVFGQEDIKGNVWSVYIFKLSVLIDIVNFVKFRAFIQVVIVSSPQIEFPIILKYLLVV